MDMDKQEYLLFFFHIYILRLSFLMLHLSFPCDSFCAGVIGFVISKPWGTKHLET